MSSPIQAMVPVPPEIDAINRTCEVLSKQNYLDRFEIAVTSRLEIGINNDMDLRAADELLQNVMRGADAIDVVTKPAISAAHATHKGLLAAAKTWKDRWTGMGDKLKRAVLDYQKKAEALAREQQRQLDIAAQKERDRLAAEARAALRSGNVVAAQAAMEIAQATVTPVVSSGAPVLEGSTTTRPWEITITDPMEVIKGIAAGVIPLWVVKEFDLGELKRTASKSGGLNWPGIKAEQGIGISVRRK